MIDSCKIEEEFYTGIVFRIRQEPSRVVVSLLLAGVGFLGTWTIIAWGLTGFENVVLRPVALWFYFGMGAVVRFLMELTPRVLTITNDRIMLSGRWVNWHDVHRVRIMRQEGPYIELCIEWTSWMKPRRQYVAGYLVEGSDCVSKYVTQYGGPTIILEYPANTEKERQGCFRKDWNATD